MRLTRHSADAAILSAILFPFLSAAVGNLVCDQIRVDKISFDLSSLGGPHSVKHTFDLGDKKERNATYTIDLCQPLKKKKNKDDTDGTDCPNSSRICAVDNLVNKDDDTHMVEQVYPIAGELKERGGANLDAKWSRLKASTGHEDSKKEGLSLEIKGGFKQTDAGKKQPQMAIIEFLCDRSRTGLENMPDEKDNYERRKREDEPEVPKDDASAPSLIFESYGESEAVKGTDLLRLTWKTKAACEDAKEKQDAEKSNHWGFFTWFILIAFLSTAAYLIFGSWLNYNRYGARGWDLLPHGDTIRDVPYLVKDAMRRVVNTVQGGGSRGGYAAV